MGNSKGRAVYEANIPDDFRRPQTDSAVESFVRQKYEKKKFIATEWVPTKPPDVPVGWEEAGSQELKKVEFKKLQLPSRGGGTSPTPVNISPRVESKTTKTVTPAALTVSLPPPTTSTTTPASSTVTDLLGLSLESTVPSLSPAQPPPPSTSSSADLLGLNSEFSAFVSASPVPSAVSDPHTKVVLIPRDLFDIVYYSRLRWLLHLMEDSPKTPSLLCLAQSLVPVQLLPSPTCLDNSRAQALSNPWDNSNHPALV